MIAIRAITVPLFLLNPFEWHIEKPSSTNRMNIVHGVAGISIQFVCCSVTRCGFKIAAQSGKSARRRRTCSGRRAPCCRRTGCRPSAPWALSCAAPPACSTRPPIDGAWVQVGSIRTYLSPPLPPLLPSRSPRGVLAFNHSIFQKAFSPARLHNTIARRIERCTLFLALNLISSGLYIIYTVWLLFSKPRLDAAT